MRISDYEDRGTGRRDAVKVLRPFIESFFRPVERPRIAILLLDADSQDKIGRTMIDMVRAGIEDLPFAVNNTLVHVPLIVRYPDRFPAGTRVKGLCQLVDLVPTVHDALDRGRTAPGLPGRSLAPAQFRPRQKDFALMYPDYSAFGSTVWRFGAQVGFLANFAANRRVLRTDRYKYVWFSDGGSQLFDLDHDPHEMVDLADQKPELTAGLRRQLRDWWSSAPVYVPKDTGRAGADKPTRQRLKALGYIGD